MSTRRRAGIVLTMGLLALVAGCFDRDRVIAVAAGRDPFGTPQPVAGLRSDLDDVQDPSLTADELEIFFTSPSGGANDIWTSRRASADAAWGTSAQVAELSSSGNDQDPTVSADGLTMHLASDRGGAGMRLYIAERSARDQPWSAPRAVGDLGASIDDVAPTLDAGGQQMIFASSRDGAADVHLYGTARVAGSGASDAWALPVALTAMNSDWQDRDPTLYDGGRGLVFASRRTDQGRTSDLFRAQRASADEDFVAAPERIDELSTAENWEGDPWLSDDGRHIYFVSDQTGVSRIYEARR